MIIDMRYVILTSLMVVLWAIYPTEQQTPAARVNPPVYTQEDADAEALWQQTYGKLTDAERLQAAVNEP